MKEIDKEQEIKNKIIEIRYRIAPKILAATKNMKLGSKDRKKIINQLTNDELRKEAIRILEKMTDKLIDQADKENKKANLELPKQKELIETIPAQVKERFKDKRDLYPFSDQEIDYIIKNRICNVRWTGSEIFTAHNAQLESNNKNPENAVDINKIGKLKEEMNKEDMEKFNANVNKLLVGFGLGVTLTGAGITAMSATSLKDLQQEMLTGGITMTCFGAIALAALAASQLLSKNKDQQCRS